MLYDYKSEETIQDVIVDDVYYIADDICDEFYNLRRYESIYVYATSEVMREILGKILENIDESFVHSESENHLLYSDGNRLLLTLGYDGMIFVETAKCEGSNIMRIADATLNYVFDEFTKKELDELSDGENNILTFGFKDNSDDETYIEFIINDDKYDSYVGGWLIDEIDKFLKW